MTTTALPPGIYRIRVTGSGVEPALLTRHGKDGVTILPPSTQLDPEQEWEIIPARGSGNIIIMRPSHLRPTFYLTYKGAPKKPEEGDLIKYHISEFPPNEWHLVIAPGFRHLLRVAGSELGIRIAPETIHPPILELGHKSQLEWVFERVHDGVEV